MALTITNPTYLTAAPSKTGQVLAPNEQSNLEVAFVGVATITLDGTITTGTINFIDGTQTIFANGDAAGTTTAPSLRRGYCCGWQSVGNRLYSGCNWRDYNHRLHILSEHRRNCCKDRCHSIQRLQVRRGIYESIP